MTILIESSVKWIDFALVSENSKMKQNTVTRIKKIENPVNIYIYHLNCDKHGVFCLSSLLDQEWY
jgi:hypothetical protein